uniref:Hydroxymethylglutaryl-CoA synthase n=1 Tax=Anopheles atroparvus TaxID=41427 RepID=A0AAG5DI14_ANOAO
MSSGDADSKRQGQWPERVGLVALEIVFPSQFVDQTELEAFDGVSAGKYTVGLGQQRMGFCSDREDINSLCLTVVRNLLDRHQVPLDRIGRLEVGTETIVDKSKSVKSVLMQLFEPAGVTDLEGIDTTNACYGGTAALLNAINWIESSSWDGRLALVVCGDIAVYAQGSARPTGGAGAVAMLVGPNAPLCFDRGLRATYMKHAYDFYKPDLSSEYPVVDGKLSIQCYLSALDACYQLYRKKFAQRHPDVVAPVALDTFDAVIFHSPYCKLVQKSLARIGLNDFVLAPAEQRAQLFPGQCEQFASVRLEDTYFDRDVEKAFMTQYAPVFEAKTKRSLHLASQVGNMYTPSVYSCLVSLLIGSDVDELLGKRVGVFSYGSGLASSMYSISVTTDREQLTEFKRHLNYVQPLLERRTKVAPADFTELMAVREKNNHAAPYEPTGSVEVLFPGTYYLKTVDSMHRRTYERVPPEQPSS